MGIFSGLIGGTLGGLAAGPVGAITGFVVGASFTEFDCTCPHCGKSNIVNHADLDKRVTCSNCNRSFVARIKK